jgi:hypothetical protein
VAGQAGIDHPGKLDVVKGKDARSEKNAQRYKGKQAKSKDGGPETLLKTKAQRKSPRAGQLLLSRNMETEQSRS